MITRKQLLAIVEKNGFLVKNKTTSCWKIPYEIKSLKEKYEIAISNVNKRNIVQAILKHNEYWKVFAMDDANPLKVQKEVEKIIKKFDKVIGEINGIWKLYSK